MLQNQMKEVWICAVVAQVWQDPWKVHQEGREESLSANGGGTMQTDPMEEVEWLDKEDEEDRVQVGL